MMTWRVKVRNALLNEMDREIQISKELSRPRCPGENRGSSTSSCRADLMMGRRLER
jgi:hypothetical protein